MDDNVDRRRRRLVLFPLGTENDLCVVIVECGIITPHLLVITIIIIILCVSQTRM